MYVETIKLDNMKGLCNQRVLTYNNLFKVICVVQSIQLLFIRHHACFTQCIGVAL